MGGPAGLGDGQHARLDFLGIHAFKQRVGLDLGLDGGNTECMQMFLDEVSARHPDERIVMIIDGAGWHRSDALKSPENIYLLKLPPYAPELNPIEHVWLSISI